MARKTKTVRIPMQEGNRDKGKMFIVTEMSAMAAEKWGRDAFKALARGGLDILPDEMEGANLALLAGYGFKALAAASTDEIDSLMARLMTCVTYVPDPAHPEVYRGVTGLPPFEEDVAEYRTRLLLQKEAFELSLGFSIPVAPSTSLQGTATIAA